MKEIHLYHITDIKNVTSIKNKGLQTDQDGLIYLFNGVDIIADRLELSQKCPTISSYFEPIDSVIARSEVWLKDYAMIKVRISDINALRVDFNDGDMTKGVGHKFKYSRSIPPEDILDISERSFCEDCSSLEFVCDGITPKMIDPHHVRFWDVETAAILY